jgi:hypothetical protein
MPNALVALADLAVDDAATVTAKDEPPLEWAWAGLSPESIEDGRTYRLLADDSTIDHICHRGMDVRVLDYVPADRLEPIAQRYLKSVGVVTASGEGLRDRERQGRQAGCDFGNVSPEETVG